MFSRIQACRSRGRTAATIQATPQIAPRPIRICLCRFKVCLSFCLGCVCRTKASLYRFGSFCLAKADNRCGDLILQEQSALVFPKSFSHNQPRKQDLHLSTSNLMNKYIAEFIGCGLFAQLSQPRPSSKGRRSWRPTYRSGHPIRRLARQANRLLFPVLQFRQRCFQ